MSRDDLSFIFSLKVCLSLPFYNAWMLVQVSRLFQLLCTDIAFSNSLVSLITTLVLCFWWLFTNQVSDNAPIYGVCLHVQEIVQKAPGILGAVSPLNPTSYKPSRFLVSAPRCYCLLTKVPFFELHYEMLNRFVFRSDISLIYFDLRFLQFSSKDMLVCLFYEQHNCTGEA